MHPAHAAFSVVYTVNTTADTHDATVGDGVCVDSGGHCSLRAAIEESNAGASGVDIVLPAGSYVLAGSGLSTANQGLAITGEQDDSATVGVLGPVSAAERSAIGGARNGDGLNLVRRDVGSDLQ